MRTMRKPIVVLAVLAACGDNQGSPPDLPVEQSCLSYEALMVSVDDVYSVPSIVPAPAGVRIIVDRDFQPFMGSSYPVPGGRMVWNVWIFRWFDGEYIGALGRVADGDVCRWYAPVI